MRERGADPTANPPSERPPKPSPVHQLRARLEKAFSETQAVSASSTANDDCVAVTRRFLELTGWSQGDRRIFEAMPHAGGVESVEAFRAILFRLGFQTVTEPASIDNLRQEYLPCFVRETSGKLVLIECVNSQGIATTFDPVAKATNSSNINDITGTAIFPERRRQSEEPNQAIQKKWSSQILNAFGPTILRVFLISLVVNVLALAPPLYVMSVYDNAIGSRSLEALFGLTVGVIMVIAADFGLRQTRARLQAYLGARLDEQSNEAAFRQLLHLPLSFIEDAPIGAQLTRLRQMTSIREAFIGALATAIFDLPFILLFIAVTALIGGQLIWVPVTLIALYAALAVWAVPRTKSLVASAGDARAQLNNLTVEAVSAHRAIRDLSAESIWLRRHRRLSAQTAVANMKMRQFSSLIHTLSQSMVVGAGVAILAIGAGMVIAGDLTAGALIAVMALSWRILGPMRNIFISGLTVGQSLQSIEQINRLMRMPLERAPDDSPSIARSFKGRIVFDRVSFRYPSAREPSLRGVSFKLEPGQLMCLTGASGSGKSTVLRILLGLQQQQAGSVFIDGLDLRQLDKGEWRRSLGVAPQAAELFFGTVAQNIRLARPEASNAEIAEITRRFGVQNYFSSVLKEGLETKYDADAQQSWPEALVRRIVLCRAFIAKSSIYLLDDPAANLDDAGERALMAAIEERRRESAIIMTTHRPSHIRRADVVVWLEDGAVRDIGPPDKVLPGLLAA